MSITLALDWFSFLLVSLAFLISMIVGFWVGDHESTKAWASQWRQHMKEHHGIDVE